MVLQFGPGTSSSGVDGQCPGLTNDQPGHAPSSFRRHAVFGNLTAMPARPARSSAEARFVLRRPDCLGARGSHAVSVTHGPYRGSRDCPSPTPHFCQDCAANIAAGLVASREGGAVEKLPSTAVLGGPPRTTSAARARSRRHPHRERDTARTPERPRAFARLFTGRKDGRGKTGEVATISPACTKIGRCRCRARQHRVDRRVPAVGDQHPNRQRPELVGAPNRNDTNGGTPSVALPTPPHRPARARRLLIRRREPFRRFRPTGFASPSIQCGIAPARLPAGALVVHRCAARSAGMSKC